MWRLARAPTSFNMKENSFMPSLKFKKIRAIIKIKTEVLARSMAI